MSRGGGGAKIYSGSPPRLVSPPQPERVLFSVFVNVSYNSKKLQTTGRQRKGQLNKPQNLCIAAEFTAIQSPAVGPATEADGKSKDLSSILRTRGTEGQRLQVVH